VSDVQTVFLVDDDDALRESMSMLLAQVGLRVRAFHSARAFLDAFTAGDSGCLVLDLRMPDMTGLELQAALLEKGSNLPVLFLSGYADVPTTVRAIKGGALDFLEKPVARDTLIARVRQALEEDRRQCAEQAEERMIRADCEQLSPREREVMLLATKGWTNKEIARQLGISSRTVENHRAHVMEKMQARNIAELCRIAAFCLPPDEQPTVGNP
jgi:two-component system, LuxR family, response regulator FixJ